MSEPVYPVYFTVNNASEQNPRSLLVMESLERLGVNALIMETIDEFEFIQAVLTLLGKDEPQSKYIPVAVFDADQKVNHWHPQLNTDRFTPAWTRATEWGVRIGSGGVTSPERIERCAKQIAALFSRPLVNSETERPWGPARKTYRERQKKVRTRVYRSYSEGMHLW